MDLGTATFTDFSMSEDVTSYIAENIELFNCEIGLLHSHNRMQCFFSGTDLSTLRSEGNDTNCFVSLIVNNEGTYCAAITRKVLRNKEVSVRNLGESYEFFGEGNRQISGAKNETEKKVITDSVVEYFMLDVQRETVQNPFDFLDKRFDEIESRKREAVRVFPATQAPSIKTHSESVEEFFDWPHSGRETSAKAKEALLLEEPSIFGEDEMAEIVDSKMWEPDPSIIHYLACQMITCSLIVNKDIDLKQWIVRHMEKKYNEIFLETGSFDDWKEVIVEFLVNQYSDPDTPPAVLSDTDMYIGKIADALYMELYQYPMNAYIDAYMKVLTRYSYE